MLLIKKKNKIRKNEWLYDWWKYSGHSSGRLWDILTYKLRFAFPEVTLATGSYVSYAGVTQILYYEKSSNKVYSINGGWNTPLKGDPSQIPKVHTPEANGASVLVPGFIAGVADAAAKFAKFPLSTLFEPALYFAENGFKLSTGMASAIKIYYNDITLLRTSEGMKWYL